MFILKSFRSSVGDLIAFAHILGYTVSNRTSPIRHVRLGAAPTTVVWTRTIFYIPRAISAGGALVRTKEPSHTAETTFSMFERSYVRHDTYWLYLTNKKNFTIH